MLYWSVRFLVIGKRKPGRHSFWFCSVLSHRVQRKPGHILVLVLFGFESSCTKEPGRHSCTVLFCFGHRVQGSQDILVLVRSVLTFVSKEARRHSCTGSVLLFEQSCNQEPASFVCSVLSLVFKGTGQFGSDSVWSVQGLQHLYRCAILYVQRLICCWTGGHSCTVGRFGLCQVAEHRVKGLLFESVSDDDDSCTAEPVFSGSVFVDQVQREPGSCTGSVGFESKEPGRHSLTGSVGF
ncbi:hypothetical protein HNY73_011615, partial [Argiope bruennichi]